jgi:hypothetical protein
MPTNNYTGVVPGNTPDPKDPNQPRAGFSRHVFSTPATPLKFGRGIAGPASHKGSSGPVQAVDQAEVPMVLVVEEVEAMGREVDIR